MRAVLFACAPFFGLAPQRADLEDAHVKTQAAVAAAHGRLQSKKIGQIRPPKMRRTQIPGSAAMAMDGHFAFLLLWNLQGEPELVCTIVTQKLIGVRIKLKESVAGRFEVLVKYLDFAGCGKRPRL